VSSNWTLEIYEPESGRAPFNRFLNGLDDFEFAALDAALRVVLQSRGLELARTEWLKPLGGGLHEFRVRHDADEIRRMFGRGSPLLAGHKAGRILFRVFVHFHGDQVILLLAGYDKGKDASERRQHKEIQRARKLLTSWREAQSRGGG
jgi:putative component of toxin-antitoxin plasmid stabilization module